jgi:hypothetical protein
MKAAVLSEIKGNGSSESNLYLFIKRVIQLTVVITDITVTNYIQNFIKDSSLKVNPICRQNYWRPSVWIFT